MYLANTSNICLGNIYLTPMHCQSLNSRPGAGSWFKVEILHFIVMYCMVLYCILMYPYYEKTLDIRSNLALRLRSSLGKSWGSMAIFDGISWVESWYGQYNSFNHPDNKIHFPTAKWGPSKTLKVQFRFFKKKFSFLF